MNNSGYHLLSTYHMPSILTFNASNALGCEHCGSYCFVD